MNENNKEVDAPVCAGLAIKDAALPDAPMTTDQAREYLIEFMERHFTDTTFHRYIRADPVDRNRLAGDFAWQMATALRALAQAAPASPAVTPAVDDEFPDACEHYGIDSFYHQYPASPASPASAPVAPEPSAPHILEALSYHERERDDLTLEDAVEAFRNGYKKVAQRDDRAMLAQIIHLLASTPVAAELLGEPDLLPWAVERWHAEVSNRPLVNVHRRSLDDTWRQVIKHCGGDPVALCGPSHDDMLAAAPLPPVVARKVLTNQEIRTLMHNYSRMHQPGHYSDTEFDCLQDVIAFVRAAIERHLIGGE